MFSSQVKKPSFQLCHPCKNIINATENNTLEFYFMPFITLSFLTKSTSCCHSAQFTQINVNIVKEISLNLVFSKYEQVSVVKPFANCFENLYFKKG